MAQPGEPDWTFKAITEWVRTGFAQRDEAQRLAREEALRVEDKVERIREQAAEERARLLTRDEYDRRRTELQHEGDRRLAEALAHHESDLSEVRNRLQRLEAWRANVMGRVVGLGVVGGLILAAVTAIITHLVGDA